MSSPVQKKKISIPTERTSMVGIRFTPDERELVKAHARALGLSLSTHIRSTMLSEARKFLGPK